MQTRVTEIADRIYLLSTYIPEAGPAGFTFNQFLIDAEEPLLFHTGLRNTFPSVSEAVATIVPLDRLRWITFGHVEFGITTSLIIGSVPAVFIGSLVSSSAPDRYIRPIITFVVGASGLKYVGVGTTALGWMLCGALLAAGVIWLTGER